MKVSCYWRDTCKSGLFEGMTALRKSELEFPTLEAALEKYTVVRAPDENLYAVVNGVITPINDAQAIKIMDVHPMEAQWGGYW